MRSYRPDCTKREKNSSIWIRKKEKTLTVGCAGGVRYQGLIPVEKETASGDEIKITIQGLLGGHSGEEIHRQRGNANKMMARLLYHIAEEKSYR